jgi:hypothetical protein
MRRCREVLGTRPAPGSVEGLPDKHAEHKPEDPRAVGRALQREAAQLNECAGVLFDKIMEVEDEPDLEERTEALLRQVPATARLRRVLLGMHVAYAHSMHLDAQHSGWHVEAGYARGG